MEKLTKEQKMDMVSKAIDMGFEVELKFYGVKSESQLDEALSVFEKDLSIHFWSSHPKGNGATGVWINEERSFEDNFNATIFIDSLRGESS